MDREVLRIQRVLEVDTGNAGALKAFDGAADRQRGLAALIGVDDQGMEIASAMRAVISISSGVVISP